MIIPVQNVHAYASACSLKVLRASPGSGNLLRPSFPPYSCSVSWICFGPYCCVYPMTILTNGALSRIPWRVRYLARGTIDKLKTRGVSPELCPKLQVKRLCVPVFRQRLVRKMFWYVYCVAVAICKSHEIFVGYFTSTSRFHLA